MRRVPLAAKVRPDIRQQLEDLVGEKGESLSQVVENVLVEGLEALEGRETLTLEDFRQIIREELERLCQPSSPS